MLGAYVRLSELHGSLDLRCTNRQRGRWPPCGIPRWRERLLLFAVPSGSLRAIRTGADSLPARQPLSPDIRPIHGTHPFGAAANSVQICSQQICPCGSFGPQSLSVIISDCALGQKRKAKPNQARIYFGAGSGVGVVFCFSAASRCSSSTSCSGETAG